MQTIKVTKKNLAVPGEPMSLAEFRLLIQEAEKGPFKPITNLKKEILLCGKKNTQSSSFG